jgi:hypothetical protein
MIVFIGIGLILVIAGGLVYYYLRVATVGDKKCLKKIDRRFMEVIVINN